MFNRKWFKCWLYDFIVEVLKVMKWRCRIEVNNFYNDEEIVDVCGYFVIEVIDLGSNILLFKKQKILGDCLFSIRNEIYFLKRCNFGEKFNFLNDVL